MGDPDSGELNLQRQSRSVEATRKPAWFLEGAILPSAWCYILGFLQHGKGRWKIIYPEISSLIILLLAS